MTNQVAEKLQKALKGYLMDITFEEAEALVQAGYTTVPEIKKRRGLTNDIDAVRNGVNRLLNELRKP